MKNKLFLFIIITIWSNGGHFGRVFGATRDSHMTTFSFYLVIIIIAVYMYRAAITIEGHP